MSLSSSLFSGRSRFEIALGIFFSFEGAELESVRYKVDGWLFHEVRQLTGDAQQYQVL